jgi:hypothetical protein
LGALAHVPGVRARGVLRLIQEQARYKALSYDQPPANAFHRIWREVGLVLCRRGDARVVTGKPSHSEEQQGWESVHVCPNCEHVIDLAEIDLKAVSCCQYPYRSDRGTSNSRRTLNSSKTRENWFNGRLHTGPIGIRPASSTCLYGGHYTKHPKIVRLGFVAKTYRHHKANRNIFVQRTIRSFQSDMVSLQKRSFAQRLRPSGEVAANPVFMQFRARWLVLSRCLVLWSGG